MTHTNIRDLQKISSETIDALPARPLAEGREPAADDSALGPFGDVDRVDWFIETVRALMAERT